MKIALLVTLSLVVAVFPDDTFKYGLRGLQEFGRLRKVNASCAAIKKVIIDGGVLSEEKLSGIDESNNENCTNKVQAALTNDKDASSASNEAIQETLKKLSQLKGTQ